MNEISFFLHHFFDYPFKDDWFNCGFCSRQNKNVLGFFKLFEQMRYFQNPRAHESDRDTFELVLSRFR